MHGPTKFNQISNARFSELGFASAFRHLVKSRKFLNFLENLVDDPVLFLSIARRARCRYPTRIEGIFLVRCSRMPGVSDLTISPGKPTISLRRANALAAVPAATRAPSLTSQLRLKPMT
jgi:hypothetical protein